MPKILSGVDGAGLVDADLGFRHGDSTKPTWTAGPGAPEGVVTAPVGSLYSRTDGGTNTALYRKETGGNTGWVATSTASGVGTFVQIAGDTMTGNLGMGVSPTLSRLQFPAGTLPIDGITWGTDTNLYRSAADTLSTDDNFQVGTTPGFLAQPGARVSIGTGPSPYVHLEIYTASGTAGQLSSSLPVYGLRSRPVNKGTGNVRAVVATAGSEVAGTVGSLSAVETTTQTYAASTAVTDSRGVSVLSPTLVAGSTMTNAYGVDIQPQKVTGVTNAYAFFQRGASDLNYFAANLGLGQTVPTARLEFAAATTAAGGINFGGDVTLYRYGADILRSNDQLLLDYGSTATQPTLYLATLNAPTLGTNMITNGTFDTDLSGWTAGAGWAWNAGTAQHGPGSIETLSQTLATVNATDYWVTATISGRTAGTMTLALGSAISTAWSTTGGVSFVLRASANDVPLTITPSTDFDGSIDAVTVQAITPVYGSIRFGSNASLRINGGMSLGESNLRLKAGVGGDNVALGTLSMEKLVTGSGNIAIGRDALRQATQQNSPSIAIGRYALANYNLINGAAIGIGENAFGAADITTGAVCSVALGSSAGRKVNTAQYLALVGFDAGGAITSGSYSTYIGYRAGYSSTATGVHTVGVGYDAQAGDSYATAIGAGTRATGSGSIAIGRDSAGNAASAPNVDQIALGTANHYLTVAGRLRTIGMTRTVPTAVGDAVDLGTLTLSNGASTIDLRVSVASTNFSVSKRYLMPIGHGMAPTWQQVTPITDSGPFGANDFAIDAMVNLAVLSLRLRRVSGSTAGTAYITLVQGGVVTDAWVASTTVNSGTTVAATPFPDTIMTQRNGWASFGGNVGIGQSAPTAKLQFASDTVAAGGVLFGTDTNLYRSATDTLRTDDQFSCAGANLNQNEAQNLVTHKLAAAPASPVEGQRYYDTVLKAERIYTGTKWDTIGDITTVSTAAPAGTPNTGDLWYDTDEVAMGTTLPLGVVDGGTGATSPATARTSLAVPGIGNSTTTAGPPTTGTWARGDQWLDSAGVLWTCVTAGAPGVWKCPPTHLFHSASPTLTVPANSTWTPYDFTITLPRAGQLILNALVRYYMNATSAAYNVLYLNIGNAPGGPVLSAGYDEVTTTGPYASAVQSGGMVPLMGVYNSVPAGACPLRLQFQVATGSAYGYVAYTVAVTATLI